jgi:hypothetical protein
MAIDKIAAEEIELWIDNTQQLYNQKMAIAKNLVNKMAAGKYDSKLAPKIFIYLIQNADKHYNKYQGSRKTGYMLDVATRKWLAEEMAARFYQEAIQGEYSEYLHKKYQKKK